MTNQLYRVDCARLCADGLIWYRVYIHATDEQAAIAYARDTEDEDGPMIYGDPMRAVETTLHTIHNETGPRFPAGYWWASDDLLAELEDWRKEFAPCRETLDLFAGATQPS